MATVGRTTRKNSARSSAVAALARAVRGLALVAVLWMVAALTIAATGMLVAVRSEVRSVSTFREFSTAGALTDAAIVLAARDLRAQPERGALRSNEVVFEGQNISVQIVPLSGLIDVNAANEALLSNLLAVRGGLARDQAAVLAQRIIDWRDPDTQPLPSGAEDSAYAAEGSPFRTRGGPFQAPEDLLQVLGFDYDLYVRVRPLLTVHHRSGGRVNPAMAPLGVLQVLAGGDEQVARTYAEARAVPGNPADSTRFPAAFIANSGSPRYLIDASMRLSSGAFFHHRRILDFSSGAEGMPWLTLHSERWVAAEGSGY